VLKLSDTACKFGIVATCVILTYKEHFIKMCIYIFTRDSGFRRDVDEMCALLGYYAALISSSIPTFWDNLSVPSSRVKSSWTF
jgi:hypothetical protein